MAGKGDKRIKSQVPFKDYSDNWDRIFNKNKNEKKEDKK